MDHPDSQCESPGHLGLGVVLQEIMTRGVGFLASMSDALSLRAFGHKGHPCRAFVSFRHMWSIREHAVKHHQMPDFTSSMRGSLRSCNDDCQATADCERQRLLWQRGRHQ